MSSLTDAARLVLLWAGFLVVMIWFCVAHRGGRKCGPNCHCEDWT